jgi:hypothetical protein
VESLHTPCQPEPTPSEAEEKHGEKKKGREFPSSFETNNSIEDLAGNEENEYPVPDSN